MVRLLFIDIASKSQKSSFFLKKRDHWTYPKGRKKDSLGPYSGHLAAMLPIYAELSGYSRNVDAPKGKFWNLEIFDKAFKYFSVKTAKINGHGQLVLQDALLIKT